MDAFQDSLSDVFARPESTWAFLSQQGFQLQSLSYLTMGLNSRVFAFQANQQDWVLKVSSAAIHVHKEALAHALLHARIPVPAIALSGQQGGDYWVIQQRCAGLSLDQAQTGSDLPQQLTAVLLNLHASALPRQASAGIWRPDHHLFQSGLPGWRAALAELHGFDYAQHRGRLLSPAHFAELKQRIVSGLDACPETLWLIHGDFKPANLIFSAGRISGVIDWCTLGGGDFAYDWAALLLYSDLALQAPLLGDLIAAYQSQGFDLSQVALRLRSYQAHQALGALWVYSSRHQPEAFAALWQSLSAEAWFGGLDFCSQSA